MFRITDDNGWLNTEFCVSLLADNKGNIIIKKDKEYIEIPFRLLLENWSLRFSNEEKEKIKERFCNIINEA